MKCSACETENPFPGTPCPGCGKRTAGEGLWGFSRREILFYSIIGAVIVVMLIVFVAACLWIISRPV